MLPALILQSGLATGIGIDNKVHNLDDIYNATPQRSSKATPVKANTMQQMVGADNRPKPGSSTDVTIAKPARTAAPSTGTTKSCFTYMPINTTLGGNANPPRKQEYNKGNPQSCAGSEHPRSDVVKLFSDNDNKPV